MGENRPPRVPFERALAVTPEGADEQRLLATNLSRGGIFVATEAPPSPGTRVALDLAAAGRFLEFAEGEVAWVRPKKGFGVRFTSLRPNAQALVEHLVARGGTGGKRKRNVVTPISLLVLLGAGALLYRHRPPPPAPPPPMVAIPEAPAPPMTPIAQVYPGEFQFTLPTGAVSTLRVTINDDEVTVMPSLKKNAVVKHVFDLTHPARLVIDVSGREPKYSWQLEGTQVVKSVRIGARNHGTRVVVDLPELPEGKRYRVVTPPTS